MLAVIYASIIMLWFWGSRQKDYYVGHKFFSSIKTLPQLIHSMPPVGRNDFHLAVTRSRSACLWLPPSSWSAWLAQDTLSCTMHNLGCWTGSRSLMPARGASSWVHCTKQLSTL